MRIIISGLPGSGKSTLAKYLARRFKLRHYSAGDFMRRIAKKRRISLLELGRMAEKSRAIDREVDNMTKKLGKRDNFVMDSRIGWHFIPKSIKVFIKVDVNEAAKRIFRQKRGVEKENLSYAQTIKNIKKRRKSEKLRFKKYYGLDIADLSNYDIIIDTSKLNIEQMNKDTEGAILDYLGKK